MVVENIHRRRQMTGAPLAEIIPQAVDEVGGPTILATFTVIAALLPMAFVSGLMGPYMSPIPINASMGMLISLAVAFSITPWLRQPAAGAHAARAARDRGRSRCTAFFGQVMRAVPRSRRAARATAGICWAASLAAILLAMSLPLFKLVVLKMLPFDNKSELQVVVNMPVGTPLEQTARVLREMGQHLQSVPEVTDYQAYAGTASPINFNGLVRQYYLRESPEQGDIQVNLVDKHHRDRKSHEIAAALRPELERIGRRYGADVMVVEVPPGPPVLSPIVAEIYGPDYEGQLRVAKRVREQFEQTPDITSASPTPSMRARRAWCCGCCRTRRRCRAWRRRTSSRPCAWASPASTSRPSTAARRSTRSRCG